MSLLLALAVSLLALRLVHYYYHDQKEINQTSNKIDNLFQKQKTRSSNLKKENLSFFFFLFFQLG